MLISQALATAAQKNPANIALKFLKDELKYGDLRKKVAQFSYLYLKILGPTPRVAFFGSNSTATALSFFAISNIRGCSIFVDTRWTNEQIAAWLKKTKATHIAVTNDLMPRTRELMRDFRVTLQVVEIEKRHGGEYDDVYTPPPENPPKDTDIILLLPTAGMTGDPKMATFNHLQLQASVNSMKGCYRATGTDRFMTDMNWSHPFAFMNGMLFPLLNGSTCIAYHGVEPEKFNAFLGEVKVTRFITDVLNAERILNQLKVTGGKLPSVRAMVIGTSYVSEALRQIARDVKTAIVRCYGQTEAGWTLAMDDFTEATAENQTEWPRMKGLAGIKYKVLDAEGDEITTKGDRTGPFCVTGPVIMAGYHTEDPKEAHMATKQVVRGTWLYTEDLATIADTDDGMRIEIHGRKGVTYARGDGSYVAPDVIDPAFKDIKGIVDGAGFILEPSKGKQILAAGVVRDANPQAVIVKEEDVLSAIRKKLMPAQVPSTIVFVEHIPRLVSGQVNRFRLARANSLASGAAPAPAAGTPPQGEGAPPRSGAAPAAGTGSTPPPASQVPPKAAASSEEEPTEATF